MDIKNKVEVIDNFIPVEYQNLIYDVLMGGRDLEGADDNGFPWYFTEDVTAAGETARCAKPAPDVPSKTNLLPVMVGAAAPLRVHPLALSKLP